MYLIINLGLKSIRSIVFDNTGKQVSGASEIVHSRLTGERVEQSASEWYEALLRVTSEAVSVLPDGAEISYASVSCSASCLVPIDRDLEPTDHVVMVSDRRASEEADLLANASAFGPLREKYGFSASPYSQLARVLWMKRHRPENHEKTWKYMSPNDYLIAVITDGLAVTDMLNAEKTFWDKEAKAYPEALLTELGLSSEKLPEVVPIGTVVGKVGAKFAAEVGLSTDIEVVVGTYDAICSVFGTGVSAPGLVCDVSGTVTSIRMFSDRPFVDDKGRIFSQHVPAANGYLLGGSNNLGGGLIEWAKACFYKESANPYQQIQDEASYGASTSNPMSGLIFLPDLLGSRAPEWNPDARGVFFGLERHHDRGDLIRAILESIAFSVRDFLEVFAETGTTPELVTASGGLAQLAIANEIKADITGLEYHYMDEFESTALGSAIIVMCATGKFNSYDEACRTVVRTRQTFIPRPHNTEYYEEMYQLYRDVKSRSLDLFEKRRDILAKHRPRNFERIENL